MNIVSFCGPKVPFNPTKPIEKLTAAQIAEAINIGVKQASQEMGRPVVHKCGEKRLTGKLLTDTNPDSFDKETQTLTETGKKGFNRIYGKKYGVKTDSQSKELANCAKEITKARTTKDGVIGHKFDVIA